MWRQLYYDTFAELVARGHSFEAIWEVMAFALPKARMAAKTNYPAQGRYLFNPHYW